MSSCCTKIGRDSPSVSRCYCQCKLVSGIKGQQKTYVWKVHRTCRIIITNFFFSSSIYLVFLGLYTKLEYKILFRIHLIFFADVNPMFFLSLHSLEASSYLLYNSWQSQILSRIQCLGYSKIVEPPSPSPNTQLLFKRLRRVEDPQTFFFSPSTSKYAPPTLPWFSSWAAFYKKARL